MTIPQFNFPLADAAELREAAHRVGCFAVRHPLFPEARCAEALADAQAFFNLPPEQKTALAIEHSAHFRGYSEMRNERDWREQIHFGREQQTGKGLEGPNLWPSSVEWRDRLIALITDLEQAGRDVLTSLATGLGLAEDQFLSVREAPYLLLKLIHYPAPLGAAPRSGVASHVDFSWITILLQDDAGGLEMRTPEGAWLEVRPVPGTLVVNIGEVLQFATRGYYLATPHRVVKHTGAGSRISLPFFLNPGLDTTVQQAPLDTYRRQHWPQPEDAATHVHRVLPLDHTLPFVFGEAEWRRKGLGIWCDSCVRF